MWFGKFDKNSSYIENIEDQQGGSLEQKMDEIIEFLAPENIENDLTFYKNSQFSENRSSDFSSDEKIAKSRWYGEDRC